MGQLDVPKKPKRFNPLEPALGVLGFIVIASLFIGCLYYLDFLALHYRRIPWLGNRSASSEAALEVRAPAPAPEATANIDQRVSFLDEGGDECDLYDGNWVWDDDYPLYESKYCPFVDHGFRCLENGRPDAFYTKWRWQPKGCNLPRFSAREMLETLRNRRLAFVGDSIGRNQWESMLCMLASAVANKSSIYEVHGSPITKHTEVMIFMFHDYNFTVEYYRAPFLVVQGRAPAGSPRGVQSTLKLDQLTWNRHWWRDADVLLFNSGHWWTRDKTVRMHCYFQEGAEVKMEMDPITAFGKSVETLVDYIRREVNTSKTLAVFRTYAAVHFRGGTWKSGGHCHQFKLPDLGPLPNNTDRHAVVASDVLSKTRQIIHMMEVSKMTYMRQDGHASLYHYSPERGPGPMNRQDCSHWCLPGVPDSWNELLYALVLKRESIRMRRE